MSRPCLVCSGEKFIQVISNEKSMSSDCQMVDIAIDKEECSNCGTIRSANTDFLSSFYKDYYKLNIENTDPLYIYKNQKQRKSDMHFDWIQKLIANQKYKKETFIEIGCGSGNLLKLFETEKKFGVEPSKLAALHASKNGSVRNIGYEDIDEKESYDIILSSCVIEHTIDPNDFLSKVYNISKENSLIIIGLPIQTAESFDVYFLDHLHHFTTKQFIHLCQKNGFEVINYEVEYKCITTLGYFILKKREENLQLNVIDFEKNKNFYVSQKWLNNINNFIKNKEAGEKIICFGYGETSFFFQTYSNLRNEKSIYIDDVKSGEFENVFTTTEIIDKGILENKTIILLTNPHYHEYIKSKFSRINKLNFYSPFSNSLV